MFSLRPRLCRSSRQQATQNRWSDWGSGVGQASRAASDTWSQAFVWMKILRASLQVAGLSNVVKFPPRRVPFDSARRMEPSVASLAYWIMIFWSPGPNVNFVLPDMHTTSNVWALIVDADQHLAIPVLLPLPL